MRTPRSLVALILVLLPLMAIGCNGDETPVPETPEATAAVSLSAVLTVNAPTVQFRAQEQQPLQIMDSGAEVDVAAGGNIVVDEVGHAMIEWPGFLTSELLSGADALLSLSLPEQREVILDQAKGTARYVLQGPGTPAKVRIKAAWTEVAIDRGTADVIVSLVAGTEPAVWVTSLDGTALVTRGGDSVAVGPSQVVAVRESGDLMKAMDVDRAAIVALYNRLASGRTDLGLADVAFRCTVKGGATALLLQPDSAAEAIGDPLHAGDVVIVEGRDSDTEWLLVRPVVGDGEGWVSINDVECVGPAGQTRLMVVETVPPTSTPVPARPSVRVIQVTATPLYVGTPTPSPTPAAAYKIEFRAEDDSIAYGTCTELRWETENIKEVYFEGKGVPGNGSQRDCPKENKTYTLRVILKDGSVQERTVEVKVRQDTKATNAPEATLPPESTLAPEPTNTDAPATQEPTTAPPTPTP